MPKGQTKYTNPAILARICRYVMAGNSKSDSFRKVGIHPDTGFAWLAWGREDPPRHEILARFERILERAWAHYNAHMVFAVDQAAQSGAPQTWQAAMTMLERRDPANWGRRETHKIEGGDKPILQLNQVVLVDADARTASRDLLRRVAGVGADESLGSGIRGELEAGEEVDTR